MKKKASAKPNNDLGASRQTRACTTFLFVSFLCSASMVCLSQADMHDAPTSIKQNVKPSKVIQSQSPHPLEVLDSADGYAESSAAKSTPNKTQDTDKNIQVSIIIDDLGYAIRSAENFVSLPHAITLAIIPFAPYSKRIAKLANQHEKEVMLHAPMETIAERKWETGLTTDMQENELITLVNAMLLDIPFAVGLNNHGGSKLTQQRQHMDWLMSWVAQNQLYFIDSRTTASSVAADSAKNAVVAYEQRDIFLDNNKNVEDIRRQYQKLISIASKRGHAIGIGHPYPETLAVLREELPKLANQNIQLVNVSELVFNEKNSPRLYLSRISSTSQTNKN